MIEKCANSILGSAHKDPATPPPIVGNQWPKRWLRRHSQYIRKKTRAINAARKCSHDHSAIYHWFETLQRTIEEHGVTHEDIWNLDEIGFQIGVERDQWIITQDHNNKRYANSNTNREHVSVVETINPAGSSIPPFICYVWMVSQRREALWLPLI